MRRLGRQFVLERCHSKTMSFCFCSSSAFLRAFDICSGLKHFFFSFLFSSRLFLNAPRPSPSEIFFLRGKTCPPPCTCSGLFFLFRHHQRFSYPLDSSRGNETIKYIFKKKRGKNVAGIFLGLVSLPFVFQPKTSRRKKIVSSACVRERLSIMTFSSHACTRQK